MKMYLVYGKSVSFGLCLCYNRKHPFGQILNMIVGIQAVNDLIHIIKISVDVGMDVMVSVCMTVIMNLPVTVNMIFPMLILMFFQMHIKIKRIQSADFLSPKMEMISFKSHTVQRPFQRLLVSSQIQQRPYCHIPADS